MVRRTSGAAHGGQGPRSGSLDCARRRRACGAGPATQIHDRAWREVGNPRAKDRVDQQEMQRSVVERERRPLAGAIEIAVLRQAAGAALDVRRGQRSQRACDIAEAEVSEMTLLEILEPPCE